MLRTRMPALLLVFFILLPVSFLYSQCLTAPPLDSCSGSEPFLADNETLTTGVRKWYYGAPAVYNQVTIRNGALVVCGDLTFTNFILDSGTVIVRPGARLRFGGGAGIILRGNAAIYNYGTVEITSNLVLEGTYATPAKPNIVMNVTQDAVFRMSNQYFVINNPNSWFVNRGQAEFWGIITDYNAGAGSVCLGRHSQTNMSVLYNNSKNTYAAPEGGACVRVDQYSQFRDTLTNNANVNICLGNTHYSDSSCVPWGCKPNAWGTASIFRFCGTCTGLELLTFRPTSFSPVRRNSSNDGITIAPNPFFDHVRISGADLEGLQQVIVYNAAGLPVYNKTPEPGYNSNAYIDFPVTLPQGAYIIKLVFDKKVIIKRIIKKL